MTADGSDDRTAFARAPLPKRFCEGARHGWVERARKTCAFDDVGAGLRLDVEGMEVAGGCDPLTFARAVVEPLA
ncbi:MAG TPA: hypothetical protein VFA64_13060 [Hyphomicrobiaceae bacterium]|nr:hypothetical protein [Hyphomicrobiaceae bacterium]